MIERNDVLNLLQLTTDELYAELLPDTEPDLFTPGAARARGKELFQATWSRVHDKVCHAYQQYNAVVDGTVDMASVVIEIFKVIPWESSIPVAPFAALVIKLGIKRLCMQQEEGSA